MIKKKTSTQGVTDLTILMRWVNDGNMNSAFPKELDKNTYPPIFLLYYFLPSPKYYVFINNTFNNYNLLNLKPEDVYRMFKEIVYNTGYKSFSKSKSVRVENPLIKSLKRRFPYYKKEEIMMAVNIIDNSEDKDIIYEMFEINDVAKIKKMTKKDIKDRQNKIKNIISSDELLSMI